MRTVRSVVGPAGAALILWMTMPAICPAAETTGSLSGVVKGQDGKPLPGIMVMVSGSRIAGRSDFTDSGGAFRFARLLPGEYVVEASLEGMGSVRRKAVVEIERDTQIEVLLEARATASVEVTAALPIVDTKSTEVARNFRTDQTRQLPLSQSYAGLFQLAPGIAENNASTGSPNAGGLRQENAYYYDGINATNPFFGDLIIDFSELDIEEVSIKRGGITAEFGRTGGIIVNAVTKSPTNYLHGEARYIAAPSRWRSNDVDPEVSSAPDSRQQAAGVGGPILKNYAWFYGSYYRGRQTTTNQVNNLGPVPDSEAHTEEYFGKLTANPIGQLFMAGTFRHKKDFEGYADLDALSAPSTASIELGRDTLASGKVVFNVTPDLLVDARYGRYEDPDSAYPALAAPYGPLPFNVNDPCLMGTFRTTATKICGGANAAGQTAGAAANLIDRQDFYRDEFRLSASLLRRWLGSTHDIRAGLGYDDIIEELERKASGWGSITVGTTEGQCPGTTSPCFLSNYAPIQPIQRSRARTYSIYLQDQVTIGSRVTLMLGVLSNRDEYISTDDPKTGAAGPTLLKFGFDETLQPRVGVSYVTDPRVGDKAFVNYGRYYNLDNKSLARAASPYRIFSSDAVFDYTTGALVSDVPRPSETGKVLLPGINPTYTDEFLAGYARPLGNGWAAEVWGMYRSRHNFIDDYPTTGRDTNPADYVYGNVDAAFQRYKAATFELNRAIRDGWAASLSYTWSRLEGNWDLDYDDSVLYSSSVLEDGPGLYVEDPNRKGILKGDREHVLKLFGSYRLPTNTTLGGYLRIQSGAPWEARTTDYVNGYRAYLEPAGSRRTPTWSNLDLLLSQAFPIGPLDIQVEFRLFNVFNTQTVLSVDNRILNEDIPGTNPPEKWSMSNPSQNFGEPTSFAPPRRGSLSVSVSF